MFSIFLTLTSVIKEEKMPFSLRKSITILFISLLVVADGVGGWNNHGVDPALYSKELCRKYVDC
jgi:serine/threonine protein phosphatase PrpC